MSSQREGDDAIGGEDGQGTTHGWTESSSSCHPSTAEPSIDTKMLLEMTLRAICLLPRAGSLKGSGSGHLRHPFIPHPCPIQEKILAWALPSPAASSLHPLQSIPETPHDRKTAMWKQETGHRVPCRRRDLGSKQASSTDTLQPRGILGVGTLCPWATAELSHQQLPPVPHTYGTSTTPLINTSVLCCLPSHTVSWLHVFSQTCVIHAGDGHTACGTLESETV